MLFTQEQQMIRDMARQFGEERIAPHARDWEKARAFPKSITREMGEMGFMGMTIPEEWGGSNVGTVAAALVIEEIARADGAISTVVSVNNSIACMPIFMFGTNAQKEKFLKPLAKGEQYGAFCLTEPQAGSDAAALSTRADKKGDHFVLNGVKQFISSGKTADISIVFAVTDPSKGKKGISAFIVPTNTPGYHVTRIEEKLGQHASDTAQITFENLEIPADYLLGAEGDGYKIALSNLEGGRIGIAAQSVGLAQAALDASITYAKDRKTFGKSIIEHQAIAFKLADMATQIEAARLLYLQAAALKDAKEPCLQKASMAKLFASEMAERVCSDAIQIHGGYGYVVDFPVEKYYRDVRVGQIYEGTSEVQRLVIARGLI